MENQFKSLANTATENEIIIFSKLKKVQKGNLLGLLQSGFSWDDIRSYKVYEQLFRG